MSDDTELTKTLRMFGANHVLYHGYAEAMIEAADTIDALAAELAALRSIVWGDVCHTYMGGCPDPTDWNRRDPECPACQLLAAHMPQPAPTVREQYDRIINEAWAAAPEAVRLQCSDDATEFHPLIAAVKMLAQPAPAQPQATRAPFAERWRPENVKLVDERAAQPQAESAQIAAFRAQPDCPPWLLPGDVAVRISNEHRVTAGTVQAIAHAVHALNAPAQPQADTVPWPVVSRFSGGASPEGVAGRVWLRLGDGPEEVEYVPAQPQAESAALDAARYRWLRDSHPADDALWVAMGKPYSPPGVSSWRHEALDAAIDAALAAKGAP